MRLIVLAPFLTLLSQWVSSSDDHSEVHLQRRYDDGSWHPTKYDRPGRLRAFAINKPLLKVHRHHHHHHHHHHRPKIFRPVYSPAYRPAYRYRPGYRANFDYGGGRPFCTKHELQAAVRACGHHTHVTDQIYDSFLKSIVRAGITSKVELAMFLTQVIWESGGLRHKAELRCQQTNCPHEYRLPGDPRGKYYYGRGYLQLSWSYNYRKASREKYLVMISYIIIHTGWKRASNWHGRLLRGFGSIMFVRRLNIIDLDIPRSILMEIWNVSVGVQSRGGWGLVRLRLRLIGDSIITRRFIGLSTYLEHQGVVVAYFIFHRNLPDLSNNF